MKKVAPFLLAAGILIPTLAGAQAPPPPGPRQIYQRLKPCKVGGHPEERLCGTLAVWENRATKQGRKIDLALIAASFS